MIRRVCRRRSSLATVARSIYASKALFESAVDDIGYNPFMSSQYFVKCLEKEIIKSEKLVKRQASKDIDKVHKSFILVGSSLCFVV